MFVLVVGVIISRAIVFGMPYMDYAGPFLSLVIGAVGLVFARPVWLVAWWVGTSNLFMVRFDLPGLPEMYYSQIILGVLVVGWMVKKAIIRNQNDHEKYIWHSPVTLSLMVWLTICGVSSLWALFFLGRNFFDVAYGLFAQVILVCSYLIVAHSATTYQKIKLILFSWLFADIVQRIVDTYLIFQEYGISISYGQLDPVMTHNSDLNAWFAAAGFGSGGFFLVLAAAAIFMDWKRGSLALGLTLFYLLTTILRGSRGGLISAGIAVLAVLCFRRRFILLTIFALILMAGVVPLWDHFASAYKLDMPLLEALNTRFALWTDAVRVIQAYPVFGAGIGSYDTFSQAALVLGTGRYFTSSSAHNSFLQMAAETGIPSLLSFVAFLGLSAWQSWRLYGSSHNPLIRSLGLGCLVWIVSGSLLGYGGDMILVYAGMVRFRWVISIAEFYTFLGLVTAASTIRRQESKGQMC